MSRERTCAGCGTTFTGNCRVIDGERYCQDCEPLGGGRDGDGQRVVVRTGSTPALHRRHGGYVSPDDAERNPEHYDRVEAHNRRRVLENASAQGARF